MPNDLIQGDWPTDIFNDQKARFKGALGPRLEAELEPLYGAINARRHPWNIIRIAALLGGGGATFAAANISEQALLPSLAATAIGFLGTHSVARKKNKAYKTANAELDSFILGAAGLDIYDVSRSHNSALQTFRDAGLLDYFEDVHYLVGLGPKTSGTFTPQSIGTRLTRTETETYTDSDGRRRTRQRIVKVFEGLMLEMDIADFDDDNRTLITSRRTQGFSGPFDRVRNGKRHKMNKIKTASLEFNKTYKVRTDDSTLAHLFLDPVRVMRLNNLYDDLRQVIGTKRVGISILITKGRAWIALDTHGLPNSNAGGRGGNSLDTEIGDVIGQAALPHIIAKHLDWPSPVPYAWQDYVFESERG